MFSISSPVNFGKLYISSNFSIFFLIYWHFVHNILYDPVFIPDIRDLCPFSFFPFQYHQGFINIIGLFQGAPLALLAITNMCLFSTLLLSTLIFIFPFLQWGEGRLICSFFFFSNFLITQLISLLFSLSSFLRYAFKVINFPRSIALAASYKLDNIVFSIIRFKIFRSKYHFNITPFTFPSLFLLWLMGHLEMQILISK